jgi:hypothetical protein
LALTKGSKQGYDSKFSDIEDEDADSFDNHLTEATNGWVGVEDGLFQVARSSLLNDVQLSTMYSHIGVRTHLLLVTKALVADDAVRDADVNDQAWRDEERAAKALLAAQKELADATTTQGPVGVPAAHPSPRMVVATLAVAAATAAKNRLHKAPARH